MSKIIVTAAFPFIPAEIGIAHIASTYLPADIFHRFMLIQGKESLFVSATDMHGVWIKKEIQETGKLQHNINEEWHQKYQRVFERFNICFDRYSRTDVPNLRDLTYSSLHNLKEKGFIYKKQADSYYCTQCQENLPQRFRAKSTEQTRTGKEKISFLSPIKNPSCFFCNSTSIEKRTGEHWFLDLHKGREAISRVIEQQHNRPVQNYLNSILQEELPQWNFTRENYIGIPFPYDQNLYVYLWYESLLGYISSLEPGIDFNSSSFHHFIGKNIVYYHGIVWPILLKYGLDISPREVCLSARGFLDLSHTDDMFISEKNLVEKYHQDYLRFFIAYTTLDSISDFSFKRCDFEKIINQILCNQIGSFLKRCDVLFSRYSFHQLPSIIKHHPRLFDFWIIIKDAVQHYEIRKALMHVQQYVKFCGEYIEQCQLYRTATNEQLGTLASLMFGCLIFLSPYVPSLAKDFNIFEGISLDNFENIHLLPGKKLLNKQNRWEKIS